MVKWLCWLAVAAAAACSEPSPPAPSGPAPQLELLWRTSGLADPESVALSADGRAAIVGGFADNQFAGAAWMWRRVGAAWQQDGPKLVGWRAINGSGGAQHSAAES